MKKINERRLIREFIDGLNFSDNNGHEDKENDYCDLEGHSHSQLDDDNDGLISKDELYNHFDLNNDGQVTTDEYKKHIEFHCKYPESLDHYNRLRSNSIKNVDCQNSYDSCSQHLMGKPDGIEDIAHHIVSGSNDDIDKHLKPLMDQSGSTCKNSSVSALLDVLQSLINCGVFG